MFLPSCCQTRAESDFDFEDYAPFVFKELRAMDGISEEVCVCASSATQLSHNEIDLA